MPETAVTDPPRFFWLKRGILFAVSVIVALAVLRWWWGLEAERRIDAFVAETHARGEPIVPADFVATPVPQKNNAAASYLNAANTIQYTAAEQQWENSSTGPRTPADLVMMRQIVAHNGGALRLARAARTQSQADWGVRVIRPAVLNRFIYISPARNVARMLGYAVEAAEIAGDDGEAVERARDLLRENQALDDKPTALIAHLVAVGVAALASQTTIGIAPRLRVANPGATTELNGIPATPAQVRALINDLLDDRGQRDGSRWAWEAEAMGIIDAADWIGTPGVTQCPRPLLELFKPMFRLDGVRGAKRDQFLAGLTAAPDFQTAVSRLRADPFAADHFRGTSPLSHLDRLTCYVSHDLSYAGTVPIEQDFRVLTMRRIAAVMIALRLYQADHAGAFPGKLNDLSPTYMVRLPVDPMRRDGNSFGYLPQSQPPVLYSVGTNGKDDGGSTKVTGSRSPTGDWGPWYREDAVFPLWTPVHAAQTQP